MLNNIINNVAIIFEGGGMRASHSAGLVAVLIENNIKIGTSFGVSAGCTLLANYISSDLKRNRESFIDIVKDERIGGLKSFLGGKGYFNSAWIYGDAAMGDGLKKFEYKTFMESPQDFVISSYCVEDTKVVYWSKHDVKSLKDLIKKTQASSSIPILMPNVLIEGKHYIDGGIVNGILIEEALEKNFEKYLIVRTQEKKYRKSPLSKMAKRIFKILYGKYPKLIKDAEERYIKYNNSIKIIDELEKQGKAYVFYPQKMEIDNKCLDYEKLTKTFEAGYELAKKEFPNIKKFLEI